jgi:hypothetical protein
MSLYSRVIITEDIPELLDFEEKKLIETIPDETERTFAKWNSRWRKEALEHFAPLGWSYLIRDQDVKSDASAEGQLLGYFLGQPLLFFDGQTQSLWIEHLQCNSLMARDQLCEIAYKLSREKHFQRLLFQNQSHLMTALAPFKPEPWNSSVYQILTTKVSR